MTRRRAPISGKVPVLKSAEPFLLLLRELRTYMKKVGEENIEGPSREKRRRLNKWRVYDAKSVVALGFNETSRQLEDGNSEIVFVCRATKPLSLLEPIYDLCEQKESTCIMLPCTSEQVGDALGIKRCIVLAVCKQKIKPSLDAIRSDFVRNVRDLPLLK